MPTIQSSIQHKVVAATVAKGLAPRQFTFTISSETLDRDKDIIKLDAWDFKEYARNPVVLASHDHQRLPVGKSVDIGVRGDKLRAIVEFPPKGIYAYADTVHDLVEAGFLKAASVGFRADQSEPNGLGGMTIKKATLLEWSICSIGSNPDAMIERAAPLVMQKWLQSNAPHHKEDAMNGLYLDIDDNDAPYLEIIDKDRTPFEAMCEHMLDAYEEMGSEKFRQLMARQLALLGPAGSIADLLRGLTEQGVPAMRNVPGYSQKQELIDVDEYALATLIGRVVAEEAGKQTRAALCQALGRLD